MTYLTWTPKILLMNFAASNLHRRVSTLIFGLGFGLGRLGIFVAVHLGKKDNFHQWDICRGGHSGCTSQVQSS